MITTSPFITPYLPAKKAASAQALRFSSEPKHSPTMERTEDVSNLVDPKLYDKTFYMDVRYATYLDFVHQPVYESPFVALDIKVVEALCRVNKRLKEKGLGLIIFDGFRHPKIVQLFWDLTPKALQQYLTDPAMGGRHSRAYSVDVSLYYLNPKCPDPNKSAGVAMPMMPSGYDDFSEKAHPSYKGGDEKALAYRDLLIKEMKKEGFIVHDYEWWHFDYKGWEDQPIIDTPMRNVEEQLKKGWRARIASLIAQHAANQSIENGDKVKEPQRIIAFA